LGVSFTMEASTVVEWLQKFVMDHGLPKKDMALFGIKCPYCGKSDRIRQLERPEELKQDLDRDKIKEYTDLWITLTQPDGSLGVCKFCHYPLRILEGGNQAEAIYE